MHTPTALKLPLVLLLGHLSVGLAPGQNAPASEKIQVTDLTRIQQLGPVLLSPDGTRVLYSVTSVVAEEDHREEYEYRTQLYLRSLSAGSASVALTQSRESSQQAAWSPDGRRIAFVRKVKDKPQLFILPVDGGEAYQLTSWKYGAGNPQWSPDGRRLLFSTTLTFSQLQKDSLLGTAATKPAWSLEKPGVGNDPVRPKGLAAPRPNPDGTLEEIRAYLDQNVADKKAKVINRLDFQGEATTAAEIEFNHLGVTEASAGAKPQLLTNGFYSFNGGWWMPDGKRVCYATGGDTLTHPDRDLESTVWVMNADGSGKQRLLAEKGRRYYNPRPSPDGKALAFLSSPAEGIGFGQLGFRSLEGGTGSTLVAFDRAPTNLTWSRDGHFLYFTCPSNGGFPLHRVNPKTGAVERLTDFDSGVSGFDVGRDQVVFVKNEVANPYELFGGDLLLKKSTRLTRHNADWLAGKKLSFPEKRTHVNAKGQTVEYWITKPTFGKEGEKYPLLLNMHGGPTAMWGPGEVTTWHEHQYFAAQGYGVVYANPRGSGGYGLAFQRANYRDWGSGPTEDVLAAATDAAKSAWVDTSRQVITGGSYAGYLTAWIVGHDSRFKAAFAQRGVYELTTFLGEANAWSLVPNYFGGYPWQEGMPAVLDGNSPYSFVDRIRTPLLIKHGENDLRTGVSQSEMLYKSLKILGRDVEYVRMPGATHELSRTGNVRQRIDRMLRMYEFFERYVGKKEAKATGMR